MPRGRGARISAIGRAHPWAADDAAFGAATDVAPKFISPTDPAARRTAAAGGPACYANCDNYLIDLDHAVIVDVEPTTAVRQAEVGADQIMLTRTAATFGLEPQLRLLLPGRQNTHHQGRVGER